MGLLRNEKGGLRWPSIEISLGPGLSVTGVSSTRDLKVSGKSKKAAGWIVEKNEDISQRSCFVESSMSNRSNVSKGGSEKSIVGSNSSSEIGNLSWRTPRNSFDSTSCNKPKNQEDKEKETQKIATGKQMIYDDDNVIIINGDESFPVIIPKLHLEGLGKKQVSTIMPRRGVLKDNDQIYQHVMQNEKINSPPRFDFKLPLTPLPKTNNSSDEEVPQTPRFTPGRLQKLQQDAHQVIEEENQSTKNEEIESEDCLQTARWSVDVLMSNRRELNTSRQCQLDFMEVYSSNKNNQHQQQQKQQQQQQQQLFSLQTDSDLFQHKKESVEVNTPRLDRGCNLDFQINNNNSKFQVQKQQERGFQKDFNCSQQSVKFQRVKNLLVSVVIYLLLSRTQEFRNRSLVIWGLILTFFRSEAAILS